jgi:hypothetical protein
MRGQSVGKEVRVSEVRLFPKAAAPPCSRQQLTHFPQPAATPTVCRNKVTVSSWHARSASNGRASIIYASEFGWQRSSSSSKQAAAAARLLPHTQPTTDPAAAAAAFDAGGAKRLGNAASAQPPARPTALPQGQMGMDLEIVHRGGWSSTTTACVRFQPRPRP